MDHLLNWILQSTPVHPDHRDLPAFDTSAAVFWKALLLLDSLTLYPPQPGEPTSFNDTVSHHLKTFRRGQARYLFDNTTSIPLQPPAAGSTYVDTETDPCKQAQTLADHDNYRSAHHRAQSSLPIAQMNPHNKLLCQALYPPRIQRRHQRRTRSSTRNPNSITVPLSAVHTALSALKPGTAFGPLNDYMDIVKDYGLSSPDQSKNNKRLQTLQQILTLILNGNVPPSIGAILGFC